MTDYARTITQMTLHHVGDSAIFGNSRTTVTIEDDAAGWFYVLAQDSDENSGSIRVELEELHELVRIADELAKQEPVDEAPE